METTIVPTTDIPIVGSSTTTTTESELLPRTFKEMLLYKMDRTLAVLGIIAIGLGSMSITDLSPAASQVATLCIGGLATYIGAKTR